MYFLYDVCNIRKKRIKLKTNGIFKNKNWHHNIHELQIDQFKQKEEMRNK